MEPIFMGMIVQIAEASVSTSRINKQRKEDEEEWEMVQIQWLRCIPDSTKHDVTTTTVTRVSAVRFAYIYAHAPCTRVWFRDYGLL